MEIVDREYLRENVEAKESKPHCVYVGSTMDQHREFLEPDAQSVCDEINLPLLWHDAFSEGRSFAVKHQVQVIPTLLFFRSGQIEAAVGGDIPRHALLEVATKAARPSTQEIIQSIADGEGEYVVVRKTDGTTIQVDRLGDTE